ncbi:MAG TPA: hypothetical protein PKE23_12595 [Anaerolineales bacterium]|nr:hypothetical protein [Anaerolineales bacterium]HNB40939.1 hypothetical protein [Anaerolineales bacterium]HNE04311.1 hypothetical protein [Anaerolineales bacterium]
MFKLIKFTKRSIILALYFSLILGLASCAKATCGMQAVAGGSQICIEVLNAE